MLPTTVIFALTAATTVFAAPTTDANLNGVTVPIRARSSFQHATTGQIDLSLYFTHLNSVLAKYKHPARIPPSLFAKVARLHAKRQNSLALTDEVSSGEDELYYGPGTVGATSPQTFTFDFDTGSSDLFVPGPSCGTSQGCTGSTKYSQTGQSEGNTTSITYGSGSVSGANYLDTVTVAGLSATNQNVVSLTSAQGFSGSGSDSLLGMAFQSIANSKSTPFFQNLIAQGKVQTQEFSFYLGRAQSNTQGQSQLTLGGRDGSRYSGAVTTVPVSSQTYWQIPLQNLVVNGRAVPSTAGQAAIDTGTTIILAPTAAAFAFYSQIPGAVAVPLLSGSATITLWAYPCSFKGTVAIQFGGKQFAINPLDFNFGSLGPMGDIFSLGTGGYCVGGVASADLNPGTPLYVVGDTFLKNWYSIYSFNNGGTPSVSFAAATGNQ